MAFLFVLGSVVLGAVLRRRLPVATGRWLTRWVLWVALPALVLARVPHLTWDVGVLLPAAGPWLRLVGAALLFAALRRRMGWSRATTGCLVLTAGLGNTSFAGLPMIAALRGAEALGPALVADQLGSFLALSTAGAVIAALSAGNKASAASVVLRVVRFPPFIALGIALIAVRWGGFPLEVEAVLNGLATTLTPTALFVVGIQLRLSDLGPHRRGLALGLGWALVGAPLLWAALLVATGHTNLAADVSVLQVAMAPMVTAGILAHEHELDSPLATAMVSVGLLLSLITVPLWSALLGGVTW